MDGSCYSVSLDKFLRYKARHGVFESDGLTVERGQGKRGVEGGREGMREYGNEEEG